MAAGPSLLGAECDHRGAIAGAAGNLAFAVEDRGRAFRAVGVDRDLVRLARDGAVLIVGAGLAHASDRTAGVAFRPGAAGLALFAGSAGWTRRAGLALRTGRTGVALR